MIGMNGVLPRAFQLLQAIGVGFPGAVAWFLMRPASAWILGLLLAAMLMPNSLEILRRFEPALDFPARPAAGKKHDVAELPEQNGYSNTWRCAAVTKLKNALAIVARVREVCSFIDLWTNG
jgi:hypothetical protein